MSACGCTWDGPGDGCSGGYVLFKHAWELHLCIVGSEFPDLEAGEQVGLWDEYERWIGRYAAHMGEPVLVREVSDEA